MSAAATTPSPMAIERQQAIENALSMALHYVRGLSCDREQLRQATAKANRAFTLLKHASQQAGETGRA